eukprot:3315362-Rhodomonas_salina.6
MLSQYRTPRRQMLSQYWTPRRQIAKLTCSTAISGRLFAMSVPDIALQACRQIAPHYDCCYNDTQCQHWTPHSKLVGR